MVKMWSVYDQDVKIGETKRIDCPICNGKKTFTITNHMGSLLWNCYKASCDVSGGKRVTLTVDDIRQSLSSKPIEDKYEWDMPSFLVYQPLHVQEFVDKWNLPADVEVMYDVKEERAVFTIYKDYRCVDAIGRAMKEKRLPKWRRYNNTGLPYTYGCGKVAVVVEDCISAVAVGEIDGFVGLAVLGTSLSAVHKEYLSQFSTAIVALDPDALPKTMQFAKELRPFVNTVKVLKLTDDLKMRNETDITNLKNAGV
tara:strand:- start:49 stop:810 length:762 start_codon:yes stop_codon:yes gene_type:complete